MEYPPGWNCQVIVAKLELYLVGSLSWTEALAVAEHLEACVDCASWLALRRGDSAEAVATPPSRGPRGGGRRD